MRSQRISLTVVMSLIVIIGGIGLPACASLTSASPQGDLQAHVNTAVAATLVQFIIETKVAAQSGGQQVEPAAQAQATEIPPPTLTPVLTETPIPTVEPTILSSPPTATPFPSLSASLVIQADQNTNCRLGPGTGYTIETVFMKGATSTVQGRDSGKNWWYIDNPTEPGQFCWVWEGSTTVQGDVSQLAVVDAPVGYNLKASNQYKENSWCSPFNCGDYTYLNNQYPIYWDDKPFCLLPKNPCYPINWEVYQPYITCDCSLVWTKLCKKSNCPAVTIVNYKNYCVKYPKCCK